VIYDGFHVGRIAYQPDQHAVRLKADVARRQRGDVNDIYLQVGDDQANVALGAASALHGHADALEGDICLRIEQERDR